MKKPENFVAVIFGASGDLALRKLLPALFHLHRQNLLPERFAVLGVSRTPFSDEAYREAVSRVLQTYCSEKSLGPEDLRSFAGRVFYQTIDTAAVEEYGAIKSRLALLHERLGTGGNCLFYLATPPSLYGTLASHLGRYGLQVQEEGSYWRRIIVEKPFGRDLESARSLNRELHGIFNEDQIYRIDHYLGKETVQNILAFRFANGIFEPLWNQKYVDHVEVTAAEQEGVENRGKYYEEAGAIRDMLQNHLLQVVGTIAMEPPSVFNAHAVRNETVKVFQSLRPIPLEAIDDFVVCGQYMESTIGSQGVPGYRQERHVAPDSRAETYVALKFTIDNWRWGGVPFYIRTGKRLPTRVTEAVIHFKRTPHVLFGRTSETTAEGNQLILRIQPDEGILLKFGMKVPGAGFRIQNVGMDFHYSDLNDTYLPSAYERLLLDCILGDATLYARSDAVEACWKFVAPLLEAKERKRDFKLYGYPAGTWGPQEARRLFPGPHLDWRYPCKNLATEGTYCEL